MRCLSFLDSALRSLFRQPAVDTLLGGPGFVPVEVVEQDGVTGYRVGGVAMANSQEFRQAVRTTMQLVTDSVSGQPLAISGQGTSRTIHWDLALPDSRNLTNPDSSSNRRLFAPVLLNPNDELYTFGAGSASDGQQHLKLFGTNTFGFEDLLASQDSDWDFDDVKVAVSLA